MLQEALVWKLTFQQLRMLKTSLAVRYLLMWRYRFWFRILFVFGYAATDDRVSGGGISSFLIVRFVSVIPEREYR